MRYYTQYKCTFVHNVRINNVPKQCVRLLYTYNLNIEENEVGPDSRQVPKAVLISVINMAVFSLLSAHSTCEERGAVVQW